MIRLVKVKDVPNPLFVQDLAMGHQYCHGHGIELGAAAYGDFHLPGSINVAPYDDDPESVDYKDFVKHRDYSINLCGAYVEIDLVGEAASIPVPDASQDYVVSSHVIEHVPDTISAFLEWKRVIRPGGTVLMVFPKRDALADDVGRPLTPLSEFIEDYYLRRDFRTHAVEPKHVVRGHYHVFSLGSMIELIAWCNTNLGLGWEVLDMEESDTRVGNGHTLVLRSGVAAAPSDAGAVPERSILRGLIGRAARAARAGRPN